MNILWMSLLTFAIFVAPFTISRKRSANSALNMKKHVSLGHVHFSYLSLLSDFNTMRTPSPKNASEVRTFASDFRTPLEKV